MDGLLACDWKLLKLSHAALGLSKRSSICYCKCVRLMEPGVGYIGVSTSFHCNDGKGNFLLHKRSKKCRDEHGKWDCGGGLLEYGSTLEDNVLREIMEEYGCRGEIQEQLPAINLLREHNGEKTHWVINTFFVKVDPEEVRNNEPEKFEELGWFTLDNLPSPLHPGLIYELEKFPEYFERYKRYI